MSSAFFCENYLLRKENKAGGAFIYAMWGLEGAQPEGLSQHDPPPHGYGGLGSRGDGAAGLCPQEGPGRSSIHDVKCHGLEIFYFQCVTASPNWILF